jgi:DNA topoisomerase I
MAVKQQAVQQTSSPDESDICTVAEPVEAAEAAGLHYVSDMMPGIRRKRVGKHFSYIDIQGKPIHDADELQRIRSLGIPPAWKKVWICPDPQGHLQATGRDAKGRKQYRYHVSWREVRDSTKYDHMIAFGEMLPSMRERIHHDLSLPGLPREKVLATVVRLLDTTMIRIGNEEYSKENHSFGLTTLHNQHVDIAGSKIHFHFRGKSGKEHMIDIRDKQLAKIVKRCQDLPGYELFEYIDEQGIVRTLDSSDVNEYLREISGQNFTAKDFRTWGGTVIAARSLQELGSAETQTQSKKNIVQAIKNAAEHLGNTPAICRNCYVHPGIIDAYMEGSLGEFLAQQEQSSSRKAQHELHAGETSVLAFLHRLSANSTSGK